MPWLDSISDVARIAGLHCGVKNSQPVGDVERVNGHRDDHRSVDYLRRRDQSKWCPPVLCTAATSTYITLHPASSFVQTSAPPPPSYFPTGSYTMYDTSRFTHTACMPPLLEGQRTGRHPQNAQPGNGQHRHPDFRMYHFGRWLASCMGFLFVCIAVLFYTMA